MFLSFPKSDLFFCWRLSIYQLVEPGGAKCTRAFIKQHPPAKFPVTKLKMPERCWGEHLNAFDVENSFHNPERCFIASYIEFKWAPGNSKIKFAQLSKSICDQPTFWEKDRMPKNKNIEFATLAMFNCSGPVSWWLLSCLELKEQSMTTTRAPVRLNNPCNMEKSAPWLIAPSW